MNQAQSSKVPIFSIEESEFFRPWSEISSILEDFPIVKGNRKWEPSCLNVIATFDIETTSFYHDPMTGKNYSIPQTETMSPKIKKRLEKRGTMYAWGFSVNGKCVFGRTWEDFSSMLSIISERYGLGDNLIMKIYIQNESFEFQWIKDLFRWKKVFATSDRYPIRARTDNGFEFCDSLIVSGMSLENMGNGLLKYHVKKLVGSLDYSLLRHSKTPLSDEEKSYLRNDNLVLGAYMQELLEERVSINKIPMTKTGFVREDIRNYCFWENRSHHRDKDHRYIRYSALMRSLTMTTDEYLLADWSFAGGFTHTSWLNSGIVLQNVKSKDIASSYPSIIVSEMFPMSKGEQVQPKSPEEFRELLQHYACIFEIEIWGLKSSFVYEHPLSRSKCQDVEDAEIDNGRIISAKHLRTAWNDVDFEIMEKFYSWESYRIGLMFKYRRGYLPKPIIEKVLDYYKDKTELKGVDGMEAFYERSKTMINAIFGMMVQKPISEEITYENGEWVNETEEKRKDPQTYRQFMNDQIDKYNKSKTRFTSFLWGCFITAYGRRNILSPIYRELKEDYIYTDTDSVKYLHPEKHEAHFEAYNRFITAKIKDCLNYYGINPDLAHPKTKNGIVKPLGVFEDDATYFRFMAKGAKRYFMDYGEPKDKSKPWSRYNLTISGVNKRTAIPVIYDWMEKNKKDFFDYFTWGRVFDSKACGKLCHSYIDSPMEGTMIDYLGNEADYKELSGVHLEETTYRLGASDDYISLLGSLERINSIIYID